MSIIQGFGWAQNRAKLERAINEVKETKGEKFTEEDVKIVYRRMLGFVIGEDIVKKPSTSVLDSMSSADLIKLAEQKAKLEKKDEPKEVVDDKPKKEVKK